MPLGPLSAHEFWIDTTQFQVAPGEELAASLRNGELFVGSDIAYSERNTSRFDLYFNGTETAITPRLGDSPALQMTAPDTDGLLRIVHEASPSTLTYTQWKKFLAFAEHKDFPTAAAEHIAKGYSQERFTERYTRHSKALIAVGTGAGADADTGMETEITALENPYATDYSGTMGIRLSYRGAPRSDAQIEVYERRADQPVTVTRYRTDATGIARFPTTPGHDYLVDAVVLRPAPDAGETEKSPVWETAWAALTFRVP